MEAPIHYSKHACIEAVSTKTFNDFMQNDEIKRPPLFSMHRKSHSLSNHFLARLLNNTQVRDHSEMGDLLALEIPPSTLNRNHR